MKLIVIGLMLVLAVYSMRFSTQVRDNQDPKVPTVGPQSELTEADRLEALASSSFSKREYKQAADLLSKALSLREKALGPNHVDVAVTLHNLANVYEKAGKYEGEAFYLRSISIMEKALGPSHPDTLDVLKDYFCSTRKNSKPGDAKADDDKAKLLKRATCLFGGFGEDCHIDGVLNGEAARLVVPPYPRGAQATQQIVVYVRINEDGKMVSANAPCGDQLLRKAAVEAAWKATFKPKLVNGKPTKVDGVLLYKFVYQM